MGDAGSLVFLVPPALGELTARVRTELMVRSLARRLDRPVLLQIAEDAGELERRVLEGQAHVAWVPAGVLMRAGPSARHTLRPVRGGSQPVMLLVGRADRECAWRRPAWVGRSTNGYLVPRAHLAAANVELPVPEHEVFFEGYEAAAAAVVNGDADFCPVFSRSAGAEDVAAALAAVAGCAARELVVRAVTEATPGDGLVITQRSQPDLALSIARALLELSLGPSGSATMLSLFGAESFTCTGLAGPVVPDPTRERRERHAIEDDLFRMASVPLLTPHPILEVTLEGDVTYANTAARRDFSGITELGRAHPVVEKVLGWGRSPKVMLLDQFEDELQFGGRHFHVTLAFVADVSCFRVSALDITERKQLEARVAESDRMASIGTLAAGVAHEINTPVQFVTDSITFVRQSFDDLVPLIDVFTRLEQAVGGEPNALEQAARAARQARELADVEYLLENLPDALDRCTSGLRRIGDIVRSMKILAYAPKAEMAAIDLNAAVDATLTVASAAYKLVADVATDFGQLPPVVCFGSEINQALLNIVVNAAHAISDVVKKQGGRGRIAVRTWLDGDHAVVSITDTGGGIPESIRARIFDPFFTTKPVGQGTGQGLAISRTIVVQNHKGSLTFDTVMGRGTTFVIRLPVAGAGQRQASEADTAQKRCFTRLETA